MSTLDPTVQVAIVTGVFGLAGIALEFMRRHGKQLGEVRAQVQNSHSTNLRDDVDGVLDRLDQVLEGQRQHSSEISGLRRDLAQERKERMAVANRLDEHIAHN